MILAREDGALVAGELEVADTFWTRLKGLIGRRALPAGAGLWIEPCSSIHMMGVRFPIDVLFVNREGSTARPAAGDASEVLKVCPRVRAWLGLAWCGGASSAVELPAGQAAELGISAGDRLFLRSAG